MLCLMSLSMRAVSGMKISLLDYQIDRLVNPQKIEKLKRHFLFRATSHFLGFWSGLLVVPALSLMFLSDGSLPMNGILLVSGIILWFVFFLISITSGLIEASERAACRLMKITPHLLYALDLDVKEKSHFVDRLQKYQSFFEPQVFDQIIQVILDNKGCEVWWAELKLVLDQAEKQEKIAKQKVIQKENEKLLIERVSGLKSINIDHSPLSISRDTLILSTEKIPIKSSTNFKENK